MMMLSEASTAMKGRLSGEDARFMSVEFDTRRLEQNALFFAIHGESKNGHDFIPAAIDRGSLASVADEDFADDQSIRHIKVEDTTLALGLLAAYWRERFDVPVVGITGSNGKTTVAAMLNTIFSGHIPGIAPEGSFNNHWGVPLTLLKLRENHRSAVIEMGMNHAGELSYLGKIVKPTIGLIINAAAAHLEGLKTIEGVAEAKGELIDFVDQQGVVVLNRDDQFYTVWKKRCGSRKVLSFGESDQADIRLLSSNASRITVRIIAQAHDFKFSMIGRHNRHNALAVIAVAVAAELPIEAIEKGLENCVSVNSRLQAYTLCSNTTLIDDSYNANLASMRAAIDVLVDCDGQKILVLGAMGELGDQAENIHQEVGRYARSQGIDVLLALADAPEGKVKQNIAAYVDGFGGSAAMFSDIKSLLSRLEALQKSPCTLLVKGSRFTKMERVISALLDQEVA